MHTRWLFVAIALATLSSVARGVEPKFYRDDPLTRDPETEDASNVRPTPLSELYDVAENSFLGAGERANVRAVNVNTIDEVPNSSWFTNRLGVETLSNEQLVQGPATEMGPTGTLTIVSGKMEGAAPGFTVRDASGQRYFVKFDPPSNPEMASGAEVIVTKFFHALGYNVPENHLAIVRPDSLVIGEGALIDDDNGRRRQMDRRDLDALLKRAARQSDGTYRALASKALEGKPVGPFRYYGKRPDDPNDIFPHEHRRELRGLLVFCAWLNHDDSRSTNSLDTLVPNGANRFIVRHHLLDFGSALGSGTTKAQSRRAGNEFVWDSRPTLITMLTLGLYVRPWIKVDYPEIPSLGRIESTYFRPEAWKPEYPNPAFANARPEDLFWAARILANLPDEGVKAVVASAEYSHPEATHYLSETLLARKSKVLKAWLNAANPVVNLALSPSGALTFENASQKAGVGAEAEHYTVQWSVFDNPSSSHKNVGDEQKVTAMTAQAPPALLAARPEYIGVVVRAFQKDQPAWSRPLTAYFRRDGAAWSLVGLERN
jgi:hypothetical protein